MRIPVVIFTFECDHACTVFAVRSALAAGLGPVFIEVDSGKPLPAATTAELRRMGCQVRGTAFKRNMNLRSLETFQGLLDSYAYVFSVTGSRHLVKLDADTYIVKSERLREAVGDDVASAGMSHVNYPLYGFCYIVSRRLVLALKDWIAEWGAFPGWGNAAVQEDKVLGTMSEKLGLGESRRWPFDPAGGFGAGYLYSKAKDSLAAYSRKYEVVTFGNRHLIPGEMSSCAKRDLVAGTMLDFHKLVTAA